MTYPSTLWVRTPDVQLRVLDWGGAGSSVIVCLHGIGGNAWMWNSLGPRVAASLHDSHRVLSVDMRGHGDSSKPASEYSPEAVGIDLLHLADAVGAQGLTLVGHSRGGWQAAFTAARWPDRVDQLVLLDPARFRFEDAPSSTGYYGGVAALQGPFADADEALQTGQQREPGALWTDERKAAFLHGLEATPDGRLRGKMQPQILEELRQIRWRDWLSDIAGQVTARTLLFVATKSDERRQAQKLEYAEKLPDVQVVRLHTTHYVHYDATEHVHDHVVGFLTA